MENKETANEEVAKQNVADSGRGIRKNHALCDRNLKFGSIMEYDKTKILRYGNYIKYLIYANVIRNTVINACNYQCTHLLRKVILNHNTLIY